MSEATTARKVTRVIRLEVKADQEWFTDDGNDPSEQFISDAWEDIGKRLKDALNKEFYWDTTEISIIEWEDDEEVIND
mgnify:CR=1 FL=1